MKARDLQNRTLDFGRRVARLIPLQQEAIELRNIMTARNNLK